MIRRKTALSIYPLPPKKYNFGGLNKQGGISVSVSQEPYRELYNQF